MSDELKPCPWPDCGKNEATLDSVVARDLYELWAVTCPHCERSVEGKDGSRQSAITAYNALPRTVQPAPSDRERRLEEALRWYADEQNYMRDYARYTGTERRSWVDIDEGDKARAALADTTNNDGG